MSAMHFDCAKRDGNHLMWYSMGEYYDEIKKVLKQAEIPEEKSFFTEAGEFFDNTLREYQEFQSNPAKWRSSVQGGEKKKKEFDLLDDRTQQGGFKIAVARPYWNKTTKRIEHSRW